MPQLNWVYSLFRDNRPELRKTNSSRLLVRLLGFSSSIVGIADVSATFNFDSNPMMRVGSDFFIKRQIGIVCQSDKNGSPSRILNHQSALLSFERIFSDDLLHSGKNFLHGRLAYQRIVRALKLRTESEERKLV